MKTVLITGGVRGIGLAIAKKFKENGARVCVTYSKDEESAANARALGLETYLSNAACEKDVVALFEKIGDIDVLVNNAGVCFF
ncbi:MAG: SDR family oxidoreductase, partial [Clostridia bacterium]|nr:SDR family oxidoreductase [Clostridia bacterium]